MYIYICHKNADRAYTEWTHISYTGLFSPSDLSGVFLFSLDDFSFTYFSSQYSKSLQL